MTDSAAAPPVSPAALQWSRKGEAVVTAIVGERVEVSSSVAFAPGARPEGTLSSGHRVRLKVHRCQAQADRFHVEGRLLDATRALREVLVAAVGAAPNDR